MLCKRVGFLRMCFERKGKPMKKTLSLMILSLLAAQPSFSSASDLVPAEEDSSFISIPSLVDNDRQRIITPISDPELEGRRPSLLRNPVASGLFGLSSRPRRNWRLPLSSIPEDAPMNTEELRPSREVGRDLDKITFKKRTEKEASRLPTMLEEDENAFEEEALRIALSAGVKEEKISTVDTQAFIRIPKRRRAERRTRRLKGDR